jgi:hypothetical protein
MEKHGGRRKGTPNKSTLEIKTLISKVVDEKILIEKLYDLAIGEKPDLQAIKLLLSYRYGYPREMEGLEYEENLGEVVARFAEIVMRSGTGYAT